MYIYMQIHIMSPINYYRKSSSIYPKVLTMLMFSKL